MHLYRGIVRTFRWSDGISTITEEPNISTCQSSATNDAPRDTSQLTVLLHGILPISRTRYVYDYKYFYGYVYSPMHLRCRKNCQKHTPTLRACPYDPPLDPYHRHQQFFWSPFLTRFNSQFSIWLDSVLVLIWLDSFFIWFDSHLTYLFSIRLTQLESHSIQASGITTLDMVSSKYSNTKIVEYSMILIIDIMFGDNTLTKSKNQRREQKKIKYIHTPANIVATWSNWPKKKISVGEPLVKF